MAGVKEHIKDQGRSCHRDISKHRQIRPVGLRVAVDGKTVARASITARLFVIDCKVNTGDPASKYRTASNAMISPVLPNHCRFPLRSFLTISTSARLFSSQNAAPLLMNPSNVTKDAIFVDASWDMPNSPRKAREEVLQERLPQALF